MTELDYIFIIGPSAVGKTTLAKNLYMYFNGVYVEQANISDFVLPEGIINPASYEEEVCWQLMLLQLEFYRSKGFKYVISLDYDDVRAREFPLLFRDYKYLILRMYSSDYRQILKQMEERHTNGVGHYEPDYVQRANDIISKRSLLPNEVKLDIYNKTKIDVFNEAVKIINNFTPATDYTYNLAHEQDYLSWIPEKHLR